MTMYWFDDGPPDGEPVVLLHSLGLDSTSWQPQVDALADEYRLIRVDMRGHGRSPAPPGPYRLADLGGDVLQVADAAGLERFHLCGLSIGGLIALWIGIHRGDRLRSLMVANTAAKIADRDYWQTRADAVRDGGMEAVRDTVLTRLFSPDFPELVPHGFAAARDAFSATDPDGYAACCAALGEADLRDDVATITVPTLVIAGSADEATPPTDARWLDAHLPDSQLEVIGGAAHVSNYDHPEAFTAAIRRHLTSVRVQERS